MKKNGEISLQISPEIPLELFYTNLIDDVCKADILMKLCFFFVIFELKNVSILC